MSAVGPDPACVVQVRAQASDQRSFGTGYLVGPGLVLTAAHVVLVGDDARSTPVAVGGPGREPVEGEVVWWRQDEKADAALVRVPAARDAGPLSRPPTRFGALVSALPAQSAEAIGFPRLQKYGSVRDQEHFAGRLSPQTGAVSGHYELSSSTPLPGPRPGEDVASWAGMSGAAVFSNGLLVGIVRSDRRARLGARLVATSMSMLLTDQKFREILSQATGWEPICEPVELSGFLESPYSDRSMRSVASLLRAEAETVRFRGRAAEFTRLESWCEGPERLAMQIVTGQGGEGKSRLVRQFLAGQRDRGWLVGVLRSGTLDDEAGEPRFGAVARIRQPVLIAVDYAENDLGEVRALIGQARAARGKVRLLLVVRERGALDPALSDPDPEVRDLFADAPELALSPLTASAQEWAEAFDQAVRDLAAALPHVPGHEETDWSSVATRINPPASAAARRHSVLALQLTALTLLLEQVSPLAEGRGEPVERTLLRHEEAYWSTVARRCGLRLNRITLRSTVASLPLVDIADQDQAARLFGALSDGGDERGRIGARWLRELYPPSGARYLGAVQPDRLAEFLLVDACKEKPDLLTRIVSVAADCGDPQQLARIEAEFGSDPESLYGHMRTLGAAVLIARSQADSGHSAGPLLDQIEHTASLPEVSDETLRWTINNVIAASAQLSTDDFTTDAAGRSVLARDIQISAPLDAALAALQVAGHRRGAHALATGSQRDLGFVHSSFANALSRRGQFEEALEESRRALGCFRASPDARLHLADHLHSHAQLLQRLDQDREAAEMLCEEVELRELDDQPWHLLPQAYERLVAALLRAGQTARARACAEQAVEVLCPSSAVPTREQAEWYVRALGVHADVLAAAGATADALGCCSRAETFLDGLPTASSEALTGDRAALHIRRAGLLVRLGDREAGAVAWQQSAGCWQQLDTRYRGHDPIVQAINCLINASVDHAALGNAPMVLAVIHEAAGLADGNRGQTLRRDHPALYEQVHVRRVAALVDADRPEQAVSEALRRWSRVVPADPELRELLADKMGKVQRSYAAVDRFDDAVRAGRLAAAVIRTIELPSEATGQAMVSAATLTQFSACLAKAGHPQEGGEAGARAAAAWRHLCVLKPHLTTHLVDTLINQAECLRLDDRYADAADVFADAVATLRGASTHSTEERLRLVELLERHAYCEDGAGRDDASISARLQAVKLRRELSDGARSAEMADTLTDLAVSYERTDRLRQALAAVEKAVAIYGDLYYPDAGRNWQRVARAFVSYGKILLRLGRPEEAIGPFANALGMARNAGDEQFAAACQSGLSLVTAAAPDALGRFLGK
ncbi:trypsin-like peptidase domain-containing protein [Streptomyces parvus]|uniref:Novel STAND NTPase 5 domain-containing protein n=1 Tax=Streptomyces parvus TaxID=66428 RepID=A0A5D4JG31_9ACTN|nr:trypsin-like peptidase domain-containing protein [Streptomyces parvus]TYR64108.1 hypothetical protein FY004_13370 [Streptomyces parvus]